MAAPADPRHDEETPLLVEPEDECYSSSSSAVGHPASAYPEVSSGGVRTELRLLTEYSLPLIGTYLLQYSFTVITTIVAGHLGADDLAATSIGMTTMNIIGFAMFEGMATALDTLCAQCYGSGDALGVGLHIQRMLILMAVAAVPVGALWVVSPWLLPFVVPQRHLAVKAGSFLRMSLIGLPGYASFEAIKRYLQAQESFHPSMVVLIICAPINALLSWLLAFECGMGLDGAALGAALANDLRPVLLVVYIVFFAKWSHKCWPGVSWRAAFSDWGPVVRLCVAGSAVNLAEWAAFEIMTLSTSYISGLHLAAQSILTTASIVMWHIPFSVSVAVSTRIGHLVGAGLIPAARQASALYAVVFTLVGLFDGAVLVASRNHLGVIFSDDKQVQDIAAQAMFSVGAFQIIDSINNGCNGVLRGLGRQSVAAWLVFFVNYLAAVPFAVWLELGSPQLGLNGLWTGLGIGMVVIAIIETVYIRVVDWYGCMVVV